MIQERWADRVRAEANAELPLLQGQVSDMLDVLATVLHDQMDPIAAAQGLSFLCVYETDRAEFDAGSLEQTIQECLILQEVLLGCVEREPAVNPEDRQRIHAFIGEVIRGAASAFVRSHAERANAAQSEFRESEDRYRTLFDSIDEGFCIIEMLFDADDKPVDYRFIELNPAFERHSGLRNAAGKRIREMAPEHEERWFVTYGRVATTGESVRFQDHASALEGRWFDVNAFRIGSPEDRRVAVIFTDITREKRAEEERGRLFRALELERSRLASAFELAPSFSAVLRSPEHVFELANPSYLQLVGHRELLGRSVREALPEIEGQGLFELLDRVYETGEPYVGTELPVLLQRTPDGPLEERYVNFVFQALHDEDGTVSGIFAHGVDVTGGVQARQRVQKQADALAAADRAKDEFLAMLGHELRNPLGAISNALHLVQMRSDQAPDIRRPLDIARRQVGNMDRLVNDLLDVARITQGKIELQCQPVELDKLVAGVVAGLRPKIHGKGLALRYKSGTGSMVMADPVRLEQIISNLLTNAIKYTEQGSIRVVVRQVGSEAVVEVHDTGIGIPGDLLPHVFDLFIQAKATSDRSQGGLGIGLTLVRSLVELHGGTVEAHSKGPGKGSAFKVILPLLTETQSSQQERTAPGDSSGLKILVVDDNIDAADTLTEILQAWGHTAEAAHDGISALPRAIAFRPDLVLLDIGLPGTDGHEVARRIRLHPDLRSTKLVAVTGYGQAEDRKRSRDAGFNAHLNKPLDMQSLLTLIAQYTDKQDRQAG